ncbi:MAG: hypothetical protein F4X20_07150 [Dehalococcoidia bacterium]|nr:hypothetical protein [Dehalococcoidia bacterium]
MTTPNDSTSSKKPESADVDVIDRMLRDANREHRIAKEKIAELRQAILRSHKDVALLSNLAVAESNERRWAEMVHELSDQRQEILQESGQQRATERNHQSTTEISLDPTQAGEESRRRWIKEFPIHPKDENYVRDSIAYWRSLTGYGRAFERAVGELFRDLGNDAKVTQYSGDGGVDVRNEKDGETTVIQCKAQTYRVSKGVLKDILNIGDTMMADYVGCASTTGFSERAAKYAADYGIDLYGPEELAELGARAKENLYHGVGNLVIETSDAPSCPDCGKIMVQRLPHHDVQPFWGCSDYPRCTGLRSM